MRTIEFVKSCIPPTTTAQTSGKRKYKLQKVKLAEAFYLAIMEEFAPGKPIEGAMRVEVSLTWPLSEAEKKAGISLCYRTNKPDFDNAAKIIMDAMAKAGFFTNDSHIVDGRVLKYNGEFPGVAVTIKEVEKVIFK